MCKAQIAGDFFVFCLFSFSRETLPSLGLIRLADRFETNAAALCALTAYLMSSALEMTMTMSFPSRVFDLGLTSPLSQGLQGNQGVHWHRRGLAQIDPKPFVGIFPTGGPT